MICGGFPESWQRYPLRAGSSGRAQARGFFTLSSWLFDSVLTPCLRFATDSSRRRL